MLKSLISICYLKTILSLFDTTGTGIFFKKLLFKLNMRLLNSIYKFLTPKMVLIKLKN